MSIRRRLIQIMGYKLTVRYAVLTFVVVLMVWIRQSINSLDRVRDVHDVRTVAAKVTSSSVHIATKRSSRVYKVNNAYEVRFDAKPDAPGEMGAGVKVNILKLSEDEKKLHDLGWKRNAFNQYASDMISLKRNLPDYRFPECKNLTFRSDLPNVSVIIPFRDEAWSTLLRTVHSVLNRTPPKLLVEIILSDDASTLEHLQAPLENYLVSYPKVKLVRLKERGGLIRTRLKGYDHSKGEAIIFLDSHCEVTKGWVEPLLDTLANNYKTVVTSIMDVIEGDDFRYRPYEIDEKCPAGTFDWRLIFKWERQPYREHRYLPVASPTLIGCLIGVSRKFFEEVEKFDEGFFIWGGENLEISFKAWMCGAGLVTLPCSHVGHVYKSRLPYDWGNSTQGASLERNLHRLAATWLDDYIDYHLQFCGPCKENVGDISQKLALRKRLNCKNFDWYIRNVIPDIFIPGNCFGYGEIRNKQYETRCIDVEDNESFYGKMKVSLFHCHGLGSNQLWYFCKHGHIRRHRGCLKPLEDGHLTLTFCQDHQTPDHNWSYREDNTLYHEEKKQCLELNVLNEKQSLILTNCTQQPNQQWTWRRERPPGPIPKIDITSK